MLQPICKAVPRTHKLAAKSFEVEKNYDVFESNAYDFGATDSYDDYYRQVPNIQNGQRVRAGNSGRSGSSGRAGNSGRSPHPFHNNPVRQRPGSDPGVEYGTPPPQFDNPFDTNDYDYDYGYGDVNYGDNTGQKGAGGSGGPGGRSQSPRRPAVQQRPMVTGFSDRRRIVPSGTNLNDGNGPPWRAPNTTGTGIVIKEMWSSSSVKRPHFIMTGNMDGNQPYVDPKCNYKFIFIPSFLYRFQRADNISRRAAAYFFICALRIFAFLFVKIQAFSTLIMTHNL